MSNTILGLGIMLFLLGIFAWGYYTGVDSERRRWRRGYKDLKDLNKEPRD